MPEPAVPPTPPVPLSALLAREDLALRRIAGPADADTVIHWAHTSEMADPFPYLLGGELLLTAGVHVPEAAGSGTYFDDYVSRIVEAGGAALGFGLARSTTRCRAPWWRRATPTVSRSWRSRRRPPSPAWPARSGNSWPRPVTPNCAA
ncbi:PucR family transcriptional regulator ligand-binding domain-containing protein [Streptomyces sp. MS1.AVA.1]|uniref:PucR family transcriptional regulator ligand-binding domain-containing protein n=1 Tax=Streptomyces machairae TaxID=3134109 RepID=A0ABU8UKJ8_9ACTN